MWAPAELGVVGWRGGLAPPRLNTRSVRRRDRAEEAVRLVVDPGGEEQGLRIAVRSGVAELERPEPVDRELAVRRGVERAAVLEVAVRHLLVSVDLPVAEVADEQVASEAAERRGCPGEAPRSVELPVLGDSAEELPVEVVGIDDAEPPAVRLVSRPGLLLAVRDEDAIADGLDPERCEMLREPRVDESSGSVHMVPAAVEHVDAPLVGEVRGVQPRS